MQEKVLSSKKNGMAMMILHFVVCGSNSTCYNRFHLSLYSNGCGRIHLVIFGMDSISD